MKTWIITLLFCLITCLGRSDNEALMFDTATGTLVNTNDITTFPSNMIVRVLRAPVGPNDVARLSDISGAISDPNAITNASGDAHFTVTKTGRMLGFVWNNSDVFVTGTITNGILASAQAYTTNQIAALTNGVLDTVSRKLIGTWNFDTLKGVTVISQYTTNEYAYVTNMVFGATANANTFGITNMADAVVATGATTLQQLWGATGGVAKVSVVNNFSAVSNSLAGTTYIATGVTAGIRAPLADGTTNQVRVTDGAGHESFANAASGGIPDPAGLNSNNTFTTTQTITNKSPELVILTTNKTASAQGTNAAIVIQGTSTNMNPAIFMQSRNIIAALAIPCEINTDINGFHFYVNSADFMYIDGAAGRVGINSAYLLCNYGLIVGNASVSYPFNCYSAANFTNTVNFTGPVQVGGVQGFTGVQPITGTNWYYTNGFLMSHSP